MAGYLKAPSGDVREPDGIRDLVGPDVLAALMGRSDAWGLLFLFGHFATLATTGYLLFLSLGTWWVVPATVLHGFIIACLFAPFHECGHNTPFKTRALNRTVYVLTGLLLLQLPLRFRYQHADHHAYTQTVERDPQSLAVAETLGGWLYYASAIPHFLTHFSTHIRVPFNRLDEGEKQYVPVRARYAVRREAWFFWGIYAAVAVASLWFQSWVVVIYWLIPRLVGDPLQRVIRMAEHVGCSYNDNVFENTRTVHTVAPLRWLCWNMPYHVEHHAIPLVPFYHLPRLHKLLHKREKVIGNGYFATAFSQLRRGIRRGKESSPV